MMTAPIIPPYIASPPNALRKMRPNIAGTTSALMTSMTRPSRM